MIMATHRDVSEELQTEYVPDINLFSGKFRLNKKQFDVSLSSSKLIWNIVESPSEKFSEFHAEVPICDILAITHTDQNSGKASSEGVIVLDYIHHVNNKEKILKRKTAKFSASLHDCQELTEKVNSVVASLKLRPRNLLVLVNPNSGSKSGKKIYRGVAPLFELSQIKTTVIYTERMFHAKELVETYDLDPFDGIVIVSGDGLYWEVLNAILLQKQRQAGVDPNDAEAEIESSQIPIGMIPAGTANGIAASRYGNKDPVSAALHVIIGKRLTAPACAIHNNGSLLTYSGLLIGYGLIGDMIKLSEENRWMGRARYFVLGPKAIMNRRLFNAEIEYQLASGVEQLVREAEGPKDKEVNEGISNTTSQGWQKLSGEFHCVDCFLAKMSPGVPVFESYDNSAMTLIAFNRCSGFQHMKTFWGLMNGKVEAYQKDFVNMFLVKAYKMKLMKQASDDTNAEVTYTDKELGLDIDGELVKLSTPEMHVRFYKDALQGFA